METHKKIKVLMFGWELPPFNSGGLGVACYGLAKALADKDVEITFVLPRRIAVTCDFMHIIFASDLKPFPKQWDQQITYTYPALYKTILPDTQNSIYASLLEEVLYYGSVAELIASNESFDIIHAHDWLSFPAAMMAKKISGKPLVSHIHATEFDRTGNTYGNHVIYDIEKAGMQSADSIVAVSNFTKDILLNKYEIAPTKITVVHNGVEKTTTPIEEEILALKKENKIILFVGRLTLQKGPDYFLQMAKKVLAYDPHVIFVMVGSGDMKEQLIRETVRLGISDNIIFTGFLRDAQLKQLYASADLFVMPSVSEPFGITGLESAMNGTPVLVSKQSGVSEVLTHALQVDFWDIDEMTNKILAVIGYAALKRTLKKNVVREVQKQTWDNSAEKIRNVYQSLVNQTKK